MKKILVGLLVILTLSQSSFAQKIRFTDNNSWKVAVGNYGDNSTSYEYYSYIGDTIVNNFQYRMISQSPYCGITLIREDTTSGKVYFKYCNVDTACYDMPDTNERILYDYNWLLGDTVYSFSTHDTAIFTVSNIDSTQIQNVWYKVWNFNVIQSNAGTSNYSVVEGIGCIANPIYPVYPFVFENAYQLICFHNNGNQAALSPSVGLFDNASSCNLSIENIKLRPQKAVVFPNSVDDNSVIRLPYKIENGLLVVIDNEGRTIYKTAFQNQEGVLIGRQIKSSGCYYYRVIDLALNKSFTGNFIY